MTVTTSLDRDDILLGLRSLIAELRSSNQIAGIRLVGGAALRPHPLRSPDRTLRPGAALEG